MEYEENKEDDLLHGDFEIQVSEKLESVKSFDDLGLKEDLLKGKIYKFLIQV